MISPSWFNNIQGQEMKIVLHYETGANMALDYNPLKSSLPTRHPDTGERYIHAILPGELKDDEAYLKRLRASAYHEVVGSDDLFEFI